jgi:adenine-specific DNA-methyltransferase
MLLSEQEDEFIFQPMITYIGNKRKLLSNINSVINNIKEKLKTDKIKCLDAFSGSGVVSRLLYCISNELYTNDIEKYSSLMNDCFLFPPSDKDMEIIKYHFDNINNINIKEGTGIIRMNYSPSNDTQITKDDRCFYTNQNANIIDNIREYIHNNIPLHIQKYFISQLLIKASINVNTSGIFKGFYKNDGVGCFGGKGLNALKRITGKISINIPKFIEKDVKVVSFNRDINELIISNDLPSDLDIVYLDPPYNQHPYGSNYFMLNVILDNKLPDNLSKTSGIPKDWKRSVYNYKKDAINHMGFLIKECMKKSKYVIISYNNEGIINPDDWLNLLKDFNYEKKEFEYETFKGSRNLKSRSKSVTEILYIISSL